MNAWTIYWILQLDRILLLLLLSSVVTGVITGSLFIKFVGLSQANPDAWCGHSYKAEEQKKLDRAPAVKRAAMYLLAFVFVPLCVASTLIPSTKTAAAMVVIPAIANNETIRKEAGDLYALAKQALREAVTDEKPKDDTLAGEK